LNCQKDSFQGQSATKSLVKPTWRTKITVLSTLLESSLNFLSNDIKKTLKNQVQAGRKVVGKFELPKKQFSITVREKIACKTHFELENNSFKHIFGILIKFPI